MKLRLDHFYYVILVVPGVVEAWQQVSWINTVTAGFSTTFSCSSSCSPNCTHTWFFLNRTVTKKKLMWTPDGRDSKVDLTCTVLKMPEARVFSTITSTVEIKNPISVQPTSQNTLPALNTSLDLVCDDDNRLGLLSDPSKLVLWYKDGQTMSPDIKNASLHFDSLLPSDGGLYQCEVSASRQTSVFSRGYLLSFNPWNVSISGPDVIFPGRLSKFTCVVSCNINIDCTVKWQFRGGFPQGSYVSFDETELKLTASRSGTSQNFTCVAENPAAGRSAEATKVVEVKDTHLSCSEEVQLNGLLLIFSLIVFFDSSRV